MTGPFTKSSWLAVTLLCAVIPAAAQIQTTLQPQTVQAFDRYAASVEQQLEQRWRSKKPFLSIAESPDALANVLRGDTYIRPGAANNPVSIPDGLIHDWVGTIFIPDTTAEKVLEVMQDFDRHSKIYPSITRSKLLSRNGNEVTGEWRLANKSPFLTLVLNVREQEFYRNVAPGKWICRAYGKDISEVQNAGTPREKVLPPGEGMGFLWRLYAYWSLEEKHGGVLAECRTLSLTRDIPPALAWMVKPYLQTVPRDSLTATLKDTRTAAEK